MAGIKNESPNVIIFKIELEVTSYVSKRKRI